MSNKAPRTLSPGPIPLRVWLKDRGISAVTGWRLRKRGWLRTVTIAAKPYVTEDAIKEFERRAAAGEFAQVPGATSNN